jgi:hypothetical protein
VPSILNKEDLKTYSTFQGKSHRLVADPILEKLFFGRMIYDVVIDPMHTLAGGVIAALLRYMTTVKSGITAEGMARLSLFFADAGKSWIWEPARTLRFVFWFHSMIIFLLNIFLFPFFLKE